MSNFNKNQLEAITNTYDKNTLVLAGPGSGKTTTLTERAKFLINEKNVSPSNIMIITFTVKSANDLKLKISNKIDNYNDITVGTFHSVCLNMIKKFKKEVFLDNVNIVNDYEANNILRNCLIKNQIPCDFKTLNKYKKDISLFKGKLIGSSKLKEKASDAYEYTLAQVYYSYQSELAQADLLDYDDILMYANALIRCSNKARKYYRDKFKYIMIDEVQDCNYAQFRLLELLYSGKNNIFLVGDVDQSIYGFRGTSPDYMINFENIFDNTKIIELTQNYRSTKTIVNACNQIVNSCPYGFEKHVFTTNEEGFPIVVKRCRTAKDEAVYIRNMIRDKVETGNFEYKDFCILYRNNIQCEMVKNVLNRSNIPYNVKGENNFYLKNEIKDSLIIIRFASNTKSKLAFREVSKIVKFSDDLVNDVINYVNDVNCDYLVALKKHYNNSFDKDIGKFIQLIDIANHTTPYVFVKEVADYLKVNVYKKSWYYEELESIKDLIHMIKKYYEDNNALLSEISDYIKLNQPIPTRRELNCVSLATIHASKGLEYNNVFLISADNITFSKNSDENRRLLYVAISRAIKRTIITYYTKPQYTIETNSLKATEFIDDIDDKYIAYNN